MDRIASISVLLRVEEREKYPHETEYFGSTQDAVAYIGTREIWRSEIGWHSSDADDIEAATEAFAAALARCLSAEHFAPRVDIPTDPHA